MMISGNLCDTFTYDPSVVKCFTHVLLKTLQELRMHSLSRSALLVVLDFPRSHDKLLSDSNRPCPDDPLI